MEIRFLVSIESYFSKSNQFVRPDTILYANPSLGAVFGHGSSVLTRLPRRHEWMLLPGQSPHQLPLPGVSGTDPVGSGRG